MVIRLKARGRWRCYVRSRIIAPLGGTRGIMGEQLNPAQTQEILHIEGLTHDGRGVARHAGKTVFVSGALPGEDVGIRLLRSHPRHDEAAVTTIVQASPERVSPLCPHFGACGGCALQHLTPAAQLAAHARRLEETLRRIGKSTARRWLPPVESAPWGYRSRARLAVRREPTSGAILVGFRREESAHLEPLEHCPVLVPALAPLPAELRCGLERLSGPAIPHEIWLAAGDEGIGIGFCFRQTVGDAERAQLQGLGAALGAQIGFGTQAAREPPRWESPPPQLHYSPEEGTTLAFAPWDFTQANRVVNRHLLSSVLELLAPGPEDQVLDLFCGIGNFTVPLARRAAAVLGVESSAQHLDVARENARRNGIGNCSFERADLFSVEGVAALPRNRYRLAVLDPPRAGAAAVCKQARALGLRGIAYVSCDTATLARDAALLREGGFKLQGAGVLDMFPHTAHAESVALFTR